MRTESLCSVPLERRPCASLAAARVAMPPLFLTVYSAVSHITNQHIKFCQQTRRLHQSRALPASQPLLYTVPSLSPVRRLPVLRMRRAPLRRHGGRANDQLCCFSLRITRRMPRASSKRAAIEMACTWWTKYDVGLVRDVPYLVESRAALPRARRARCEMCAMAHAGRSTDSPPLCSGHGSGTGDRTG